jgi:hypothetical protein
MNTMQTTARRLLVIVAALVAACRPAPREAAAPASRYTVVDMMPRFFTYWDSVMPALGADSAALVREFRARVVGADTLFWRRAANGPTDARIRAFLRDARRDVATMRVVHARLGQDLLRHQRTFADSFPDFAYDGTVFFYPSLYVRDGGTMAFPPSSALMFGVDMIARLNGPEADLGVLFHHELFHLYHAQQLRARQSGPPPFFMRVWGEGLATYASGRLNPGRSDVDLLLQDSTLAREGTARLPRLAAILLDHMETAPDSIVRAFQQGGGRGAAFTEIPPRSGYLVGLVVARELGRRRSVRELARLDADELRPLMTASLRRMANRN